MGALQKHTGKGVPAPSLIDSHPHLASRHSNEHNAKGEEP